VGPEEEEEQEKEEEEGAEEGGQVAEEGAAARPSRTRKKENQRKRCLALPAFDLPTGEHHVDMLLYISGPEPSLHNLKILALSKPSSHEGGLRKAKLFPAVPSAHGCFSGTPCRNPTSKFKGWKFLSPPPRTAGMACALPERL